MNDAKGPSQFSLCEGGALFLPAGERPSPAISIVTPFQNVDGAQFRATAACILRQTLVAWEWIIVDDFSDNTESLTALRDVVALSARIRVVRTRDKVSPEDFAAAVAEAASPGGTPKGNLARARNVGARNATSPLVLFLDGDDLLEPTAAEKWYWFLDAHPNAHFVNSYVVGFGAWEYLWTCAVNPSEQFWTQNVAAATAVHRVSSLLSLGGFNEEKAYGLEDYDMWLRYADAGMWGQTLPEPLFWYRRRATHSEKWKDFTRDGLERFKNALPTRFPRLLNASLWPHPPFVSNLASEIRYPTLHALGKWPIEDGRLHVVLVMATLGGSVYDDYNLAILRGLVSRGWNCTVVVTGDSAPAGGSSLTTSFSLYTAFREVTADIIFLDMLLPHSRYLDVVSNVIVLRRATALFLAGPSIGLNMLSILQTKHRDIVFAVQKYSNNIIDTNVQFSNTLEVQFAPFMNVVEHSTLERTQQRALLNLSQDAFVIYFLLKTPSLEAIQTVDTVSEAFKTHSQNIVVLPSSQFCHDSLLLTKQNILPAADILVLSEPSVEKTPPEVYSAMASGITVIAADTSITARQRVIVDNESGFLFSSSVLETLRMVIDNRALVQSVTLSAQAIAKKNSVIGQVEAINLGLQEQHEVPNVDITGALSTYMAALELLPLQELHPKPAPQDYKCG